MLRKFWTMGFIAGAALGCGAGDPDRGTSLTFQPGEAVDLDGDGVIDGFAVDENGDGIADGVDTNNDGKVDAPLPGKSDAGAAGGATTGVANGSTPPASSATGGVSGNCEELVARAMPTTPDMLIVLDRSGSMRAAGNDERVERWVPSVAAVKSITDQLDEKIRFGLMTFPSPCNDFSCVTMAACLPGKVNVPIALSAGPSIATFLNMTQPNGGTPTGASLEAALTTLEALPIATDGAVSPRFVLLVTDGQPTCPTGRGMNVNPTDIAQSTRAIDALLAKGAKTYVIGYGTKTDASLATVLDEFATHGGTMEHRAVENEATLVSEFTKIAGEIVSCTYNLDTAPMDPRKVLVELDGKQLNFDQPDGWSIMGKAVTVQGPSCTTLQDGKNHTLSVKVKCEIVPII